MQPKRIIISVLVVILMFGAAVMSVSAAQTPFEVTVGVDPEAVVSNEPVILQAGDKLDVNITINSNPGAVLFSFFVDYDENAFTIDTDENGEIIYTVGDVYDAEYVKVFFQGGRLKVNVDNIDSDKDNNKTGVLISFPVTVNEAFHGETDFVVDMESVIEGENWDTLELKLNNTLENVAVHDFGDGAKEDAGDCVTDATLTYTCVTCKHEVVIVTETAPGHTEVIDEAVDATCTTAGKTEGKHCSVCDEVITEQEEIPALGHTEVIDAAVEATCTTAGKTEGKHCSVCDEVITAQEEVPAKGHTPGAAATCTTAQVCTVCNTELEAAKGHTEVVDEAVEPTYSEEGKTEGKHCSVCNEVLKAQETIAKKSSLWIWIVVIAVLLVAGAVVAIIFVKKKKKN